MSAHTPTAKPGPQSPAGEEREAQMGLRMRLWLACIAGGAVAGLGSLWVLGTRMRPGDGSPPELLAWLAGVAFAAVLVGVVIAMWLDHHVVGHLRGLARGLGSGRVSELRGLPSASGWGELSQLAELSQQILAQQRLNARAAEELEAMRVQLASLHGAIDRWVRTEAWEAPPLAGGPLAEAGDALARGVARRAVVDEQNVQAARQVATELAAALADAQESAEQAERGFVEATAMLTTVRELQRLSGELQGALVTVGAATAPPDETATRDALEDLVKASQESVESIGRGMLRVQDVADLVQQLANRATLVAIHAVSGGRIAGAPAEGDLADELKDLVRDVRDATERSTQYAQEVEAAVADASQRMHEARGRAATRLEARATAPAPAAGGRGWDDAQRLLERVREMVQDAARKGERLSAAGERASRAAERLARRVNEESAEAYALAVRLQPVGPEASSPTPDAPDLRLLGDAPDEGVDTGARARDTRRGEDRP